MENEFLPRIAHHLIMHAGFLTDLGLYHGKMGIVMFFAHYARYTGNQIYGEFAGELLDEIFNEIHDEVPIDFESGLCGIGWGIEYLLENRFIEGDSDEILWEIDRKVMERDVRRVTDLSQKTGLKGILLYVDKRMHSSFSQNQRLSFDKFYLSNVQSVIEHVDYKEENPLLSIIQVNHLYDTDFLKSGLGIENGCAGIGLKKILQ